MLNFQENEIITLTTDDGENVRLEYMGSTKYQGLTYGAFYPVPEEDEDILDADYDMLILKVSDLDGSQAFDLVEDQETLDALSDLFLEQIFGEEP